MAQLSFSLVVLVLLSLAAPLAWADGPPTSCDSGGTVGAPGSDVCGPVTDWLNQTILERQAAVEDATGENLPVSCGLLLEYWTWGLDCAEFPCRASDLPLGLGETCTDFGPLLDWILGHV